MTEHEKIKMAVNNADCVFDIKPDCVNVREYLIRELISMGTDNLPNYELRGRGLSFRLAHTLTKELKTIHACASLGIKKESVKVINNLTLSENVRYNFRIFSKPLDSQLELF